MMSRMTASSGSFPMSSNASRPPGHLIGSIPSMRSRVSTSSAMIGWSSTIKIRGFRSESNMALPPPRHARATRAADVKIRIRLPNVDMSERSRLEDDVPGRDARRDQSVEEPGAEPGRTKMTLDGAVGDADLDELEHVLELDLVALHADDLAHPDELPRAVGQPSHLDED